MPDSRTKLLPTGPIMLSAEPKPPAPFGRRLLGSFLAAAGGWFVASILLFGWICLAARRQPIAPTFFDACALSLGTGMFVFGTWLLVLWPLYVFVPLRFPLWHWPVCTLCGATAGFVLMALFLGRVPPPTEPAFPLLTIAVLAGGCTCLLGALTAPHFHRAHRA